jgi:hypothetical protein
VHSVQLALKENRAGSKPLSACCPLLTACCLLFS